MLRILKLFEQVYDIINTAVSKKKCVYHSES